MEKELEIFGISLFPHIYAIPLTILLGIAIGYYLRGRIEGSGPEKPAPYTGLRLISSCRSYLVGSSACRRQNKATTLNISPN